MNAVSFAAKIASLPVRGAWIEISCRDYARLDLGTSLPVRGAWIEILRYTTLSCTTSSLPVRGAWIEMELPFSATFSMLRRSPCGERGLKWVGQHIGQALVRVAPRAGSVD